MNRQDLLIAKALAQAKARRVIEKHMQNMEPDYGNNERRNLQDPQGIGGTQAAPEAEAAPPQVNS